MERATGIGLRAPHLAQLERERPAVGFLEIHAENYLAPSTALQAVERLRLDYDFSVHAVGLSLGSVDGVDEGHLERVAGLVKRLEPRWISDHLAWSISGGRYFNELLPLPYTEEALDVVARNVQRVQEALGRPISIENPACYLAFRHSTLSEPAFLGELVRRTGCGLLLDANNVFVSAHNLRLDPQAWRVALPAAAVTQYHLAGHAVNDADGEPILIDDHGSAVREAVWALYADFVRSLGEHPTLIEWDTDIPSLEVLLEQAATADRLTAGARSHACVA
ncbi:MAG: DUF692 domain-containing protein [Alphaproteobacteria bacterium]|nr:DUF692 domain-containing protein [Alphaproteobacteria bacterium]